MAFDETTIQTVLAQVEGAPEGIMQKLDADLREVLHHYRRRMERINNHTRVLAIVAEHGYNVTLAAQVLDMTREGVYKHLRKSTEIPSGVDTKAA